MNDADLLKKAVEESEKPQQHTRSVPYGPVPMAWNVSQALSSEGPVVVLSVQTPEGDKIFFLNPSMGKQLGEAIVKTSTAADSGLILPQ